MGISTWLATLLILIGCGCLGVVGFSLMDAASFQAHAAQVFARDLNTPAPPEVFAGLPIGRLDIPRLQVSVMVVEGDDDATLARAVGHLPGTALPWDGGNAVLAGHRDTFFRPLREVRDGDAIRMTTVRGTFEYRVVDTKIVQPDDLSVIAPTPGPSLTLVTCYPFVYVGRAPQRFVIRAESAAR